MLFVIKRITLSTYIALMSQEGSLDNEFENNMLVIFRGFTWSHVVSSLAKCNNLVSGGFSSKRHISSHLSVKHHAYILALFNFYLLGLNNCISFNTLNPHYLLPKQDLTKNRRYNVKKIYRSLFINKNKGLKHLENKMFDDTLNSNNANSSSNN